VADALRYAHDRNIIHRDVKPSNILFDEEDRPLLTDFGIAKILETDEATLTGTGMGVGTPEYMAPEQWQGKTSAATDQYALGVVLYELITGRKPYSADTPAAVAIMQATEPLQAPSKIVGGITETVEKVLYKALARNPEDRYKNMEEFVLALRRLLAEADTAEPILPQKERRKPGPVPVPQASDTSESVTRDALDTTPAEGIRTAEKTAQPKKRALPNWELWAGIGIAGLVIIGLAMGIYVNLINMGKGVEGPLAMLATETPTITLTSTQTLGVVSTQINPIDGAEMVYVPAGEFLMGSDEYADSDEAPEHTVYLDDYWIYKYEVTNEQFAAFVAETGYVTTGEERDGSWVYQDGGWNWTDGAYWAEPKGPGSTVNGKENYPVIHISWYDAAAYCEWAGGRLPTEAEWEKAARGTEGQTYPWGDESPNCNLAQFSDCPGDTVPVGSFPEGASPYGALDMAGNVWEWVADWYDEDYYQNSPSQNPTGPASGTYRVFRGGSWYLSEWALRATNRYWSDPGYSYGASGFRCLSSGF
jgi:serine/threonine-protein kinase